MSSTWEIFLSNQGKGTMRWIHYFPVYERHFSAWKDRSFTFLEIGVARGGSGPMWSKYFGPKTRVVGIDIDPVCKKHETENFAVRIGDQSDPGFLQSLIDEFGVPDIVLDDGSHQQDHIYNSFSYIYPQMGLNGVYFVEDLHCSYQAEYKGGLNEPTAFLNRCKNYIDQINGDHSKVPVDPVLKDTFSISIYDSIAVLEKGRTFSKNYIVSGVEW
jgi:hypothetical protein